MRQGEDGGDRRRPQPKRVNGPEGGCALSARRVGSFLKKRPRGLPSRHVYKSHGGKKMKATGFKRIGKRFGAKLLMIVLCVAMLVSSVSAFAMPKIAEEEKMGYGNDGMGHYYSAFSSNEELQEATKEKNIEIASEGTILLKNGGGVDGTEDKLPAQISTPLSKRKA